MVTGSKPVFGSNTFVAQRKSAEIQQGSLVSARLAQSVERVALNHVVVGSIPTMGVFYYSKFLLFDSLEKKIWIIYIFK